MNNAHTNAPLAALRHHVTGAIERGEKTAIAGIPAASDAGKLAGLLEKITQGNWYLCPGDAMQHYRIESPGYVNALEPIATFKGPDRLANGQLCQLAPQLAASLIETVAALEALANASITPMTKRRYDWLESKRGEAYAALANARKVTEGGQG